MKLWDRILAFFTPPVVIEPKQCACGHPDRPGVVHGDGFCHEEEQL